MEGYVPGAVDGATARALSGGGAPSGPLVTSSSRPATIRPLTAAYQASSGPNQVCMNVRGMGNMNTSVLAQVALFFTRLPQIK